MSAPATFSNVAVSTAFNSNAATWCISLAWIMSSGLRTCDSRASVLLNLPSDNGVISMTMDSIPVAASLSHDLVLGIDWFQFVHAAAPQSIVHLNSGSLDVRHPLPSRLGATLKLCCSSPVTPLFRGEMGADPSASSSHLVRAHPSSSTPRTRGVDAVAACTLAATSHKSVDKRDGMNLKRRKHLADDGQESGIERQERHTGTKFSCFTVFGGMKPGGWIWEWRKSMRHEGSMNKISQLPFINWDVEEFGSGEERRLESPGHKGGCQLEDPLARALKYYPET
ncbi:hypothetical protein DFH09DRAFT_1093767 [Mycena vulgaris]|nr:hypothetical protein DFH09DRAFT_1093767 [Mycena vulgaris]